MPTYPLATLAAQVTPAGISAPTYADILASLVASYQSIFGSDAYLEADAQDYQLLAIFAAAINDANQVAIAIYNSFAPAYAVGTGLDRLVKVNGIRRLVPTNSTVDLTIIGQAQTPIIAGIAQDTNKNLWNLPASVTIPEGGEIVVTAVAQNPGAITALAGTVTSIFTPTKGWQTVNNVQDAVAGAPVESDAALRIRQGESTALPAQTPLQSIQSTIEQLTGVQRTKVYENDTDVVDGNGLNPHSIAAVVEGGDVTDIATAIERKKNPGTGTNGDTSVTVTDPVGMPIVIHFYELNVQVIYVKITVQSLTGWLSTTATELAQAITDFINARDIGEDVYLSWIFGVANLKGDPLGETFYVTEVLLGTSPGSLSAANIPINFRQAAATVVANVEVDVL